MTLVEVHGWGTDLTVAPLSDDQFRELTEIGVTAERLMEIEDGLWRERWCWSGFASDWSLFHILVDGKEIDLEGLEGTQITVPPYQLIPQGQNYLVVEESQKGCWLSARSRKRFRPNLLFAACDTVILPSGEKYRLLAMSFDGKHEFGGTTGKEREVFIISAEGRRHPLNLA